MRTLVQSQTAARLKKLASEVRHVARKPKNADAIHDLRVSIRRLRQVLKAFEEWFDRKYVKRIRRSLRDLMDRCAAVRDCDVAMEVLRSAGWQDRKLFTALEKERLQARENLTDTLEHWRRQGRVGKWRELLRVRRSDSKESAGESARRLLPAMIDDLLRAGRLAASPDSDPQTMHRFRLKTKRVRYTLELFEPVYGERITTSMESLKALQAKLGEINDCVTTLEMIGRDRRASAAVRRLAGEREAGFRAYAKKHFATRRERVRWKAVLDAADRKK